jgi:osmotically-inducible protein OsmY
MSGSLQKAVSTWAVRSAVLAGGLVVGSALADSKDRPAGDWQLALHARNTLWDEAPFDKLNLGVTVRDGVAYLSGPVPSSAVADQAIARLRKVAGIRDVKNETFVPAPDEPQARAMPHPVTAQRPSVSVGPAVSPPEQVSPPPVAPVKETVGTHGPPITVPVKRMTIADQIESLRLDDRRFENVRVEVNGGRVVLRGTVAKSADAWEFAASVRQLNGVTGVVQSIATQPR